MPERQAGKIASDARQNGSTKQVPAFGNDDAGHVYSILLPELLPDAIKRLRAIARRLVLGCPMPAPAALTVTQPPA